MTQQCSVMQDYNLGNRGSMKDHACPELLHHRRKHMHHYRFSGDSDTGRGLRIWVQVIGIVKEGQGMNTRATTVFQDKRYVAIGPAQGDRVGANRQYLPSRIVAGR